MDDLILYGTIRLALVLFTGSLILRGRRISSAWARGLWTGGFLFFLAHVLAAFHFHHHWSHAEAYEHVARRTREQVGLNWGGGIFLNYALLLWWGTEVAWWWVKPLSFLNRSRWVDGASQAFFLFMFFNASVVFAEGWGRALGVGCFVLLTVACGLAASNSGR